MEKMTIATFHDSSWANMPGLKSQGGFVNVLCNVDDLEVIHSKSPKCNEAAKGSAKSSIELKFLPLTMSSTRIKRVVRSTFCAEVLAMIEGMDKSIAINGLLNEIIYGKSNVRKYPSTLFCDCMSVVSNCQVTCPHNLEKRLRLDLLTIREAIEENLVKVRWIPTEEQLADCFTKYDPSLAEAFGKNLTAGRAKMSLY